VGVDVVAVGRVGAGAEPDARVRQLDLVARHRLGDQRQRAGCVGRRALLQAEGVVREAQLLEPVHHDAVVVVARQDRDVLAGQRFAHRLEERQRDVHHVGEWLLAQLEHVPEQHDLVRFPQSLEQDLADGRTAQHVCLRARAEVEVRQDGG
jgi:hypothetical protein